VDVDALLGVPRLREGEHGLSQMQGLADQLVAGGADHGAAVRQVVDEARLVAGDEVDGAAGWAPAEALQAHLDAGASERRQDAPRDRPLHVGQHVPAVPGLGGDHGGAEQDADHLGGGGARAERRGGERGDDPGRRTRAVGHDHRAGEAAVEAQVPAEPAEVGDGQEVLVVQADHGDA
jgi:hypothetical protein